MYHPDRLARKYIYTHLNGQEKMKESLLTLDKFSNQIENSSEKLSIEEKQRVIRALIDEIIVYEEKIIIRHCIPMGNNLIKKDQNCPLQGKRCFVATATKRISSYAL